MVLRSQSRGRVRVDIFEMIQTGDTVEVLYVPIKDWAGYRGTRQPTMYEYIVALQINENSHAFIDWLKFNCLGASGPNSRGSGSHVHMLWCTCNG